MMFLKGTNSLDVHHTFGYESHLMFLNVRHEALVIFLYFKLDYTKGVLLTFWLKTSGHQI